MNEPVNKLVDHFASQGNFDHTDMDKVKETGEQHGIGPLDAGKAFFVARERNSLIEGEILDGGTGEVARETPLYGDNSIHDLLFGKTK